jgi:SPW repeat
MWGQIFNIILGIWLMAAPQLLNYHGMAADNDHIIGPVVTSFAIIALSGCTAAVGKYNIPLGAWLLCAPWVLDYDKGISIANDIVTGVLIIVFALFRRTTNNQYGGGWSYIFKRDISHPKLNP